MKQLTRFLFIATVFTAFFGTIQISQAQTPNAVFEKLYAELRDAMGHRDAKATASLLAPGFTSEDASGTVKSAEQMLAELSALPQDAKQKSQTTLLSVSIKGNVASVVQRYLMTTTKVALNGETKSIELNAVSSDTWKLIDGSWKQLRTVTEQMDYMVNGQTVVRKMHAPN
jgi:hypothetical protein